MEWYPSHNGFHDELVLAAIWLYKATNDINYLNDAKARYHAHFNYGGYEYSWDEKVPALHVLLAQINPDNSTYHTNAVNFFAQWLPGACT
jgi:endoglucanase